MISAKKNYNLLKKRIIEEIGKPQGQFVVLAAIESFGIRDLDVLSDYGLETIHELAKKINDEIAFMDDDLAMNFDEKEVCHGSIMRLDAYTRTNLKWFFKYYGMGLFHLFPIFLQVFTIIAFNYSLWTFLEFNILQSTAVVLGVILGFIISGGFVQVIGRQTFFYWDHKKYHKTEMLVKSLFVLSLRWFLIAFAILWGINFFFNLYPQSFISIVFVYAFLIGTLLLTLAPLHPIKKRWAISISISIASIIALILHLNSSLHPYLSHWIGIVVSIGINLVFLKCFFKQKKETKSKSLGKPKIMVVAYKTYKYFFYGVLLYVFIFLDRLIAWSSNGNFNNHFIFLYEKNYEIGMDLAILMFFLLTGILEFAIASFSKMLDVKQNELSVISVEKFRENFSELYNKHIGLLMIAAILSGIIIYLIITQPWGYLSNYGEEVEELSSYVCIVGSIGYFFLSWGMLNVLYMFTLNVSRPALNCILRAILVNMLVGWFCSRIISFEFSSVGFLVGSIVFMVLTRKELKEYFNHLEYYYSAAY